MVRIKDDGDKERGDDEPEKEGGDAQQASEAPATVVIQKIKSVDELP